MRAPTHRSTRVTLSYGPTAPEVVAEVWIATAEPCPWCGQAEIWAEARPQRDYRICTACRRGWQRQHEPHTPDNNEVFAQIVEQLAQVGQ
ncbi:MAG: hypothetical protein ACREMN_11520 [Gemmatimonadales bacterium]